MSTSCLEASRHPGCHHQWLLGRARVSVTKVTTARWQPSFVRTLKMSTKSDPLPSFRHAPQRSKSDSDSVCFRFYDSFLFTQTKESAFESISERSASGKILKISKVQEVSFINNRIITTTRRSSFESGEFRSKDVNEQRNQR